MLDMAVQHEQPQLHDHIAYMSTIISTSSCTWYNHLSLSFYIYVCMYVSVYLSLSLSMVIMGYIYLRHIEWYMVYNNPDNHG